MSGVCAASDIWSVGCTVIELLTCVPPYYDLQPMPALFRIVQVCLTFISLQFFQSVYKHKSKFFLSESLFFFSIFYLPSLLIKSFHILILVLLLKNALTSAFFLSCLKLLVFFFLYLLLRMSIHLYLIAYLQTLLTFCASALRR